MNHFRRTARNRPHIAAIASGPGLRLALPLLVAIVFTACGNGVQPAGNPGKAADSCGLWGVRRADLRTVYEAGFRGIRPPHGPDQDNYAFAVEYAGAADSAGFTTLLYDSGLQYFYIGYRYHKLTGKICPGYPAADTSLAWIRNYNICASALLSSYYETPDFMSKGLAALSSNYSRPVGQIINFFDERYGCRNGCTQQAIADQVAVNRNYSNWHWFFHGDYLSRNYTVPGSDINSATQWTMLLEALRALHVL